MLHVIGFRWTARPTGGRLKQHYHAIWRWQNQVQLNFKNQEISWTIQTNKLIFNNQGTFELELCSLILISSISILQFLSLIPLIGTIARKATEQDELPERFGFVDVMVAVRTLGMLVKTWIMGILFWSWVGLTLSRILCRCILCHTLFFPTWKIWEPEHAWCLV